MADILIGTSGWSYKEWEGPFYPEGEKTKLTYYSKYFRTVEIDSTFYAYPKEGMVIGALRNTPPDFLFSAKLPKLITHDKRLDPGQVKPDLLRFLRLMRPLLEAEKLGPLLVQLPPSFGYSTGLKRLRGFLDLLPSDVRFAAEFRNRTWLGKEDALDLLRSHNVAVTAVDEPLLPAETTTTADFAFVRWHGRGDRPWYDYRYKQQELEGWKEKVEAIGARTKKVFGYFNNHFHGFAVENSLQMMEILGSATADQRKLLAQVSARIDASFRKAQGTLD